MIRGRNVIVVGQDSPRTLRDVAVRIEQFRLTLGGLIRGASQPLSTPTLVMAFESSDAMKPFVPLYNGKPISVGGLCFCGRTDDTNMIMASLAGFEASSSVVFHEYTHLLVHNGTAQVPVWLSEGIAEFFSTFQLRAGDREALIGSPIERHVLLLRERFIPLTELLAVNSGSPLYNEGTRRTIFYAESWALTHYLLVGRPDGNRALNAYLEGKDRNPEAFAAALGTTLPDLQTALRQYVQRLTFTALKYHLTERLEVDAPEQARTLDPAEAEARLGELQLRSGRVAEAAPRIEAAATAGPEVAEAQLALALLRTAQQRVADAMPALDKAATLAPNDFLSHYLYGLTLLRHGSDGASGTAVQALEQAHAELAKAIAVNPESAAALSWSGYADLRLDVRRNEAAEQTLRAVQLAPGRLDYQLQLATIYLRDPAKLEAGKSLLRALATQTAMEPVAERARATLIQLAERERLGGPLVATPPPARAGSPRTVDVGPAGETVKEHPETQPTIFKLRKVLPGEERLLGELTAVDCGPAGVRFHVRGDARTVMASAAKMDDVDLISFLDDKDFALSCGAHARPERVYLTWRPDTGLAVAVEFLPR